MCAKDRSQNSVCSQTELVNSLFHLADVSSCPCLIRDSSGIIVHSNLLLTSKILEDIFISLGFKVEDWPQIEKEEFNFDKLNIPVKFIGLGESMDDLQEFDLEQYIYGLCKNLME